VDRFSSIAIRFALVWMLLGIVAGAAMLTDQELPGNWRLWMGPTHTHMLLVGWFFQFTLGIAYWLLPRRRSTERPVGYDERLAFACLGCLNLGLAIRAVIEPQQRAGHEGVWTQPGYAVSAVAQVAAFSIVAVQLWPRVAAKAVRAKSAAPAQASPER
jgi:hypothetical protein